MAMTVCTRDMSRRSKETSRTTKALACPRGHCYPCRAAHLAAQRNISPRWGCQAGWDSLPLPDRSDPREVADKQSFHRLVKDGPIPRRSRLVFCWNKNALFEILSSAFWKAASADTRLEEK